MMPITTPENAVQAVQHNSLLRAALQDLNVGLETLYGAKKPKIILYGSYARGEANEHSDVDILLLYQERIQPGPEITRLSYIAAELNLRYALLVSLQPVSETQFQHAIGPFWTNVRREGIPINGF